LGFLTLAWGLRGLEGGSASGGTIETIAVILTWIAVGFCLLRGLPVLIEAPELFREGPAGSERADDLFDEVGGRSRASSSSGRRG
jgi:hypothetical protein